MNKKFLIEWMTCASCVMVNQKSLEWRDWIEKVAINLATKQANIEYDDSKIDFETIKQQIKENGFEVNENLWNKQEKSTEWKTIFRRFLCSLIFSLPVFSMMFWEFMLGKSYFWVDIIMYIYATLSAIVIFIFWWHFHKKAFLSLKKLQFNMDSLVSLGTLTAFFYSAVAMFFHLSVYFEAGVSIITLINLWKLLEHKAKAKAGDAIGKLLELWAKKAIIKSEKWYREKEIDEIQVGEIISVKAGEKIALDGEIIEWSINVDESMLTWESIPVYKQVWDDCYGWTINLDGNILLKVKKENSEGTLANIIKLVEQAQSSKAPIEHLADTVSGIFVPIIIGIAIITFISWFVLTGDISKAVITSVACLVIACPCALWLATPTAIMVGTGVGAKNGILIKDAETLEKTKDIDVVVFDKTWTLTNAKPEVTDIIEWAKNKNELVSFAKSLSSLSNHPLSKAITNFDEKISPQKVDNFEEIRGKWLQGTINNQEIRLWNKKLFTLWKKEEKHIDLLCSDWKTPIIVGTEKEIYWIIWLIDLPKKWVENTIQKLHSMNIEVVMLTGDTQKTADFIAEKIGIDRVIAEVMPEDKLSVIQELQAENKKVAFVGDGINDAPALVQSDLSIAMGTGSDIAIESSDIVLVKGNLDKVVSAIHLSRQTLKVIKQNLFWAFIYNTIGIPLASFGLLNPIFASFAMSMSSVSVISNSLRLKWLRR